MVGWWFFGNLEQTLMTAAYPPNLSLKMKANNGNVGGLEMCASSLHPGGSMSCWATGRSDSSRRRSRPRPTTRTANPGLGPATSGVPSPRVTAARSLEPTRTERLRGRKRTRTNITVVRGPLPTTVPDRPIRPVLPPRPPPTSRPTVGRGSNGRDKSGREVDPSDGSHGQPPPGRPLPQHGSIFPPDRHQCVERHRGHRHRLGLRISRSDRIRIPRSIGDRAGIEARSRQLRRASVDVGGSITPPKSPVLVARSIFSAVPPLSRGHIVFLAKVVTDRVRNPFPGRRPGAEVARRAPQRGLLVNLAGWVQPTGIVPTLPGGLHPPYESAWWDRLKGGVGSHRTATQGYHDSRLSNPRMPVNRRRERTRSIAPRRVDARYGMDKNWISQQVRPNGTPASGQSENRFVSLGYTAFAPTVAPAHRRPSRRFVPCGPRTPSRAALS